MTAQLPAPTHVDPVAVESFLALFDDCAACANSGECLYCDGHGSQPAPALGIADRECGVCLGTGLCRCCHDIEAALAGREPEYAAALNRLRAHFAAEAAR